MKINKDLYIKDLIKTNQTTSNENSYSCTYINTQFNNTYKRTILSTHSGVNLNDYTSDGFYHFDTVPTCTNAPTNGWYPSMNYFLLVFSKNKTGATDTNLIQLWFCASPSSDTYKGMWMRCKCYSNWYGWVKL